METKIILGEPEFIGEFPIRQDIKVLPANAKTIDKRWKIESVYNGFPIMKLSKYAQKKLTIEQQLDPSKWPLNAAKTAYKYHKLITTEDGLSIGDRVIIHSSFSSWRSYGVYLESEMIKSEDGNYVTTKFNGDDRGCWTTTCVIHPDIIEGKCPLKVTL